MSYISESGHGAIPVKPAKKPKSKSLAGWKDYVEPFQRNAQFWYSIWLSAGKPINTELHRIMKRTKNIFHYQVRRCRRVEDYLKNNKIVENCLENDTDLFEEIKKQRKVGSDDDVTIDGASGKAIPNEFAKVYKELYNREQDEAEIDAIMTNLTQDITEESLEQVDKINIVSIKEALDKIKPDKSDPTWDFSSDFLKRGPDLLWKHLEIMIKSFVVHGHVTNALLFASLVPIVKGIYALLRITDRS